MLNRIRHAALIAATLALAACSAPREGSETPLSVEATYRLLFNDLLVGNALFELHIAKDGNYRIEAFTVPAGQMRQAAGHEVLESSEGMITADEIRPLRFDHSVMEGEHIEVMNLRFDWDRHALHLSAGDTERDIVLPPHTHDRLSYLLAARRLAAAGAGMQQIQVASIETSEETRLEIIGSAPVEVPFGHYQAVGVQRITPDADETRQLWFDPQFGPLPLRVVHVHDGNTVEMQLEGFSRRPNDPR